jgi:YbbR domain-containing protein
MKRWIFENLGLKLLAFLIAFSLWAYVGSRQILERKVVLHLELTEIPGGMTVDSSVRTTVPVVLTGRKESVLEVDPDDLTAVVSLKGYTKDKKDLLVHPLVQPLPSGVAATVSAIHVHLIPTNNHK